MGVCELCFRKAPEGDLPADWDIIWQSLVCPECQKRAKQEGKDIPHMKGGCYADGRPDPREIIIVRETFKLSPYQEKIKVQLNIANNELETYVNTLTKKEQDIIERYTILYDRILELQDKMWE